MHSNDDLVNHWLQDIKPNGWQSFVYLSESSHPNLNAQSEANLSNNEIRTFSLATAKVGTRVCIVSVNCGEANNRLMGMGFIPGAALEVISQMATGSVIVALQDHRLGLGAEMAQHIQVRDAEHSSETNQNSFVRMKPMQIPPKTSPLKLRDAAISTTLRVIGYETGARDYKRKLLAMGLTPGTKLLVKRHAPLGDPTEIEVRGFSLSLRKHEADALLVELVCGDQS